MACDIFVHVVYAANTRTGMLVTSGLTTAGESVPSPIASTRPVATTLTMEAVRGIFRIRCAPQIKMNGKMYMTIAHPGCFEKKDRMLVWGTMVTVWVLVAGPSGRVSFVIVVDDDAMLLLMSKKKNISNQQITMRCPTPVLPSC
jgi:hypothetical protein